MKRESCGVVVSGICQHNESRNRVMLFAAEKKGLFEIVGRLTPVKFRGTKTQAWLTV